jgi:hypothetical protein
MIVSRNFLSLEILASDIVAGDERFVHISYFMIRLIA